MRTLLLLQPPLCAILTVILLTALTTLTSASGLQIDVTSPVECTRKTKKGDNVDMHYRGTLAGDGSEFDASYNRGKPLSFQLGAGRVIKGYVSLSLHPNSPAMPGKFLSGRVFWGCWARANTWSHGCRDPAN
jgi:hypothetical protein